MGYTIYWQPKAKFSDAEWDAFVSHCQRIINTTNTPLTLGTDYSAPPLVGPDTVMFGGSSDDTCEVFYISRNDLTEFAFCKTRRLPYTAEVTACCAAAVKHLGWVVSCDGYDELLDYGMELFRETDTTPSARWVDEELNVRLRDIFELPDVELPLRVGAGEVSLAFRFVFEGTAVVNAADKHEAWDIIKKGLSCSLDVSTVRVDDRIKDYDIGTLPVVTEVRR